MEQLFKVYPTNNQPQLINSTQLNSNSSELSIFPRISAVVQYSNYYEIADT